MGVYNYTDPQTGQSYQFEHAGEAPTNEDFAFIADYVRGQREQYSEKYEDLLGEEFEPDDGTAVGRGLSRGLQRARSAVGETIGTAGEKTGLGFLENFGEGMEEKGRQSLGRLLADQPERLESTDVDSLGSALTYAGEVVGEQIPQLAAGITGAAVVAPVIGASGFLGGAAVAGTVTAPILFGNNIQRQEDEVAAGKKDSVDVGAALNATFGQAALEGIADKILLGGLLRPLGKSIFTRTVSRATGGATTEGLTEVGQQMLERSQAGLSIDSDDAIAEYREAAIAGMLVGGGTRATFGAFQGAPDDTVIPDKKKGEKDETPPTMTQDEIDAAVAESGLAKDSSAVLDADIGKLPAGTSVKVLTEPELRNGELQVEIEGDLQDGETYKMFVPLNSISVPLDNTEVNTEATETTETEGVDAASSTTGATTVSEGTGTGDGRSESSVVGESGTGSGNTDTEVTAPSNDGPVGGGELSTNNTATSGPNQFDSLIEARKAIVDDPEVLSQSETFLRDELSSRYSVQVIDQIIAERRLAGIPAEGRQPKGKVVSEGAKAAVEKFKKAASTVKPAVFTDTETTTKATRSAFDDKEKIEEVRKNLEKQVEKQTSTPVQTIEDTSELTQAEMFDELPTTPRGEVGVRDTQGPRPNVIPQGQPTLPLQQPEGVGPRGLVTPPPPTGVPTTGQTTGTAGQVIPPGVQVPATPEVVGAPVAPEVLEAAETARKVAAQQRIDKIFDSNRGKQTIRREMHDTQVDPRMIPDTATALDKEAVADLIEAKDTTLDANAKAAKIYFKRFRRPIDAVSEIGGVMANGPTQQSLETDEFSGGRTKKKKLTKAEEKAEAGRFYYAPDEFAYYKGMTQQNARKAKKWVDENMSQPLSNELDASYNLAARDTSAHNIADNAIRIKREKKDIDRKEERALQQRVRRYAKDQTAREEEQNVAPIKMPIPPWEDLNNKLALINPIHNLNTALLPSIRNALLRGDLRFALDAISATNNGPRVRQIAAALAENVGTTKVEVVDSVTELLGKRAVGFFEPETNTIYIDINNGMNTHTLLHEMTHAVTSAAIADNPSLPEVQQLQTLLEAAREQFGDVYGTRNLDEFVAEAFSNPQFQSALGLTKTDGTNIPALEKFLDAVKRVVRKLLGLSPGATYVDIDANVEALIAPAPETRAAGRLLMESSTSEGSGKIMNSMTDAVPVGPPSKADQLLDVAMGEGPMKTFSDFVNNFYPVNVLTDKMKTNGIPFAPELNVIINKMSGALREKTTITEAIGRNLGRWQTRNRKESKILNNIIPQSTFLQVDPSRTDKKYLKYIKEDRERTKEYNQLRKEFNKLGQEGQNLYRQIRDHFRKTYDDILKALDARLKATIPDAEMQKSAFKKLQEILQKESGLISPYFPLMRKGQYRLSYNAPSPQTGNVELFVEYYETYREAQRAEKALEGVEGVTEAALTRSASSMNFDSIPPTSFIRDVLDTMKLHGADKESMQAVVDLALTAMPERSFMQNFRRRKGVRGFIGDTTPTGMGGIEFDAYTMLKEKGRDLDRQLVQMVSSAEIEGFIKKLNEPVNGVSGPNYFENIRTGKPAATLLKIANFAKSPNINRYSQIANNLGFGFTMGLNFSSAAITFFDVAMSAMPVLAGTYGVVNTSRAYGTATKALAGAPTTRTIMVTGSDGKDVPQELNMGTAGKSISNYTNEQLLKRFGNDVRMDILVESGLAQNQFNQSMIQEQLEIGQGGSMERFNKVSSFMFHHAERFNRETTLTAAYMLEVQAMKKKRGKNLSDDDYRDAAQKAIEHTEFTLGATASAGRPVFSQSAIGNVLMLFKRFAISKYYMMAKLARESIGTTNISKIMEQEGVTREQAQEIAENRRAARAASRNFLIMTGLLSGLGGMPMMGAIGAIYNILSDDDEDDFESALRKAVGEPVFQGLANEILGIDVANRIALNSLIYRPPIVEKDQSPFFTFFEQVGGPVFGVSNSIVARGIPDMFRGAMDMDAKTFQRGFEAASPAAARNFSKGLRFGFQGANTRRGDAITEDINPYNAVMQGLGFAPQNYSEVLDYNRNERRKDKALSQKRGKLLRRRNMAIREGDGDEVRRVDRLIANFNRGLKPEERAAIIDSDAKERSQRSFKQTTAKMRGGVTFTPAMLVSLKEYDQGFRLFD